MYDRLVHFSFGFLLAYPIREVFLRVTRVKGFWGYYFRSLWDAQKDMTMAGIGALLAMIVIALINLRYQAGFWQEMKASFKIEAGDGPLGERRLKEMRSGKE